MLYTSGMHKKCIGCLSCFSLWKKAYLPCAKALNSSRLSQKTGSTSKRDEKEIYYQFHNWTKEGKLLQFDEDIFCELPDPLRFSMLRPQTSLSLLHATLRACSRRIKLCNYCLNHFPSGLYFVFIRETERRKISEQKIFWCVWCRICYASKSPYPGIA